MAKKLIIGCLVIAVVVTAFSIITAPRELLSISSPRSKYTVQISERRVFPFIDSESVYLDASAGGKAFLRGKLLYQGDFMDSDFTDKYPTYAWRSESVLKIGQREVKQLDSLQIANQTPVPLKYLLIETYEDKFVIFDVEPGETINLDFHYAGRLSVQGESGKAGERFGSAVELTNKIDTDEPKQFLINVTGEQVNIESPMQTINQVGCCAVDRASFNRE